MHKLTLMMQKYKKNDSIEERTEGGFIPSGVVS